MTSTPDIKCNDKCSQSSAARRCDVQIDLRLVVYRPRMIRRRFFALRSDSCSKLETRLTRLLIGSLFVCFQRAG